MSNAPMYNNQYNQPPQKKSSSTGLVIAITVLSIATVVVLILGILKITKKDDDKGNTQSGNSTTQHTTASTTETPQTTETPKTNIDGYYELYKAVTSDGTITGDQYYNSNGYQMTLTIDNGMGHLQDGANGEDEAYVTITCNGSDVQMIDGPETYYGTYSSVNQTITFYDVEGIDITFIKR